MNPDEAPPGDAKPLPNALQPPSASPSIFLLTLDQNLQFAPIIQDILRCITKVVLSCLFDLLSNVAELSIAISWVEPGKLQIALSAPQTPITSQFVRVIEHALIDEPRVADYRIPNGDRVIVLCFSVPTPLHLDFVADAFDAHLAVSLQALLRTLHGSVPIRLTLSPNFVIDASGSDFNLVSYISSKLRASIVATSTTAIRKDKVTSYFCANVEGFPPNSLSLISFENFRLSLCREPSLEMRLVRETCSQPPMNKMGFTLDEAPVEFVQSLLPTAPLRTSLQLQWKVEPGNSNKQRISNLVLMTFVFKGRKLPPETVFQMLTQTLTDAASKARNTHSVYFSHPEAVVRSQETPTVTAPSKPTAATLPRSHKRKIPPKEVSLSKTDSPGIVRSIYEDRSQEDTKLSSNKANTSKSKSSAKHAIRSLPSAISQDPSSKEDCDAFTAELPQPPPSSARTAKVSAPTTSASPSASSSAKSHPELSNAKPKQKRKRSEVDSLAKVEDDAQLDVYLGSILDSITSIVRDSQNPDFVSSCLSTLGLSTSSPAPSSAKADESSAERIQQFRQVLERDLRIAANALKQRPHSSYRNKTSRSAHTPQEARMHRMAELEDEEDLDWIEGLTPQEIEALWKPQPVIPSDTQWTDQHWTPYIKQDLNEERFEQIQF